LIKFASSDRIIFFGEGHRLGAIADWAGLIKGAGGVNQGSSTMTQAKPLVIDCYKPCNPNFLEYIANEIDKPPG